MMNGNGKLGQLKNNMGDRIYRQHDYLKAMREIIDIEYSEFFEVGDKVCLVNKCGVVVQTYEVDLLCGRVIGGQLIVCWDTSVECDFQVMSGQDENFLFRIDSSYEFKYINDDGTKRID